MSDALIGKQLGDYQIRDLLGRGGMARVYTGYDARLDRLAAVKVINSDFSPADRAEYFERFQREARAIARLNHPNIVGVYQFGQYEDSYYMAMVFVEGRDLRQILREYNDRRELIPVGDVLNVVRGIGSALDYAHGRGVIHRDIKPSNIMLTREGNRAILTDFGLALSTSEGTRGETFGSAHYIAPEQAISSAKAVPQSDLYSLGICLYEMLTGQVPFDDPSAMTVALKHLQDPPPAPRSINPKLSAAIEHVLLKSIDKDPTRRYLSGAELIRALEGAFENQTLPDTSEVPVGPIKAALEQSALAKAQEKPKMPVMPSGAVPSPGPFIEKKPTSDSAKTPGKAAAWSVGAVELPPPPADAVETERGNSSAIRPPSASVLTGQAKADATGTDQKSRRPGWLIGILAVLIVLVILGGGYAVGQNAGLFGAATTTAISPSGAAPKVTGTGYTQAALLVSITPTTAATDLATRAATESATTVSTRTPSAVPTASATVSATASPTPPATTALLATADVSPAPSATLLSPSANPPPLVATDTTVPPTATIVATSAATISAGASSPAVEGNNDVVLLYNGLELYAVNQSNRLLSLTGITFNQVGTTRTFSADEWLKISPALKPGDCYQLKIPSSVVLTSQYMSISCLIMAYYGPRYSDTYYFWAAIPQTQTPPSSAAVLPSNFNVLYNGQVIANCLNSDGRCSFSLPKSAN